MRCSRATRPTIGQRRADLGGDGPQPGEGRLLVGLVLEAVDAGPTLGVVARGAGEGDRGAAVRAARPTRWPPRPAAARPLSATQSSPERGRGDGGAIHRATLGCPRTSRRGPPLPFRAMSDDDDGDDDAVGRVPPLPPDDRLWRHPSELSSFGHGRTSPPVAPVAAGAGRPPVWPIALVAGFVGAVLCGGVLAVTGNLSVDAERVVERVKVSPLVAGARR